ncbi:MAG: LysR family transcriptional regulator, partial [Hyphomicrobiales bacterium]|nr:LysR family transcriptional regulator [Hyphomicrobiales bacterium]
SQQIKALETGFGTRLFQRTKRSVRLTPAGTLVLKEVRKVLEIAERTRAIAVRAGRGELGVIEAGFVGTAIFSGVVAAAIFDYRQSWPDVDIHLHERGIADQIAQIDEHRQDLGFIRLPVPRIPAGIAIEALTSEAVWLAIHDEHPLARKENLHIGELQHELFIVPSLAPATGFYALCEAVWKEAGFEPRVEHKSSQLATICSLVAAGAGIALVPESLARLKLPNVRYRPLQGVGQRSQLALVYRKNEAAPALKAFIAHVRNAFS